jgi:hypothetical protein
MGRPVDGDGNEVFVEYPKVLADGHVAHSAEEEAAWGKPLSNPVASDEVASIELDEKFTEPAQANPLDDVTIEMDNPAFQPPKKTAAHGGAKKK